MHKKSSHTFTEATLCFSLFKRVLTPICNPHQLCLFSIRLMRPQRELQQTMQLQLIVRRIARTSEYSTSLTAFLAASSCDGLPAAGETGSCVAAAGGGAGRSSCTGVMGDRGAPFSTAVASGSCILDRVRDRASEVGNGTNVGSVWLYSVKKAQQCGFMKTNALARYVAHPRRRCG